MINIHKGPKVKIRIHDDTSEFRVTKLYVKEDTISPIFFTVTLDNIFPYLDWNNIGLSTDTEYLDYLKFADNLGRIPKNPTELIKLNATSNKQRSSIMINRCPKYENKQYYYIICRRLHTPATTDSQILPSEINSK